MKACGIFVSILILIGFSGRCGATVYNSNGTPGNTFHWSSPLSITKAIKLQGAGSGRIIGWSRSSVSFGTGTKVFTVQAGFTAANGTTLRIWKTATSKDGSYMLGTVTSVSGTTLTINITTNTGGGSAGLWLIATECSTKVVHDDGANTLITITENTADSVEIS